MGTGTIDVDGDDGFLVSVVDGQVSGGTDRFRIKIWERATGKVIYDSQPGAPDDVTPATEPGGGSIVLHIPKK
jgi:hypothetical protein